MATENPTEAAETNDDGEGRERSAIRFPYMDLDDAISVARAIHQTTGGSPCAFDQLAAKLELSLKSSGFQVRLATARLFGLIESTEGGVKLTALGQRIIDTAQERAAKVSSFLAVPLYKKVHEHYLGKVLPPAAAFERELLSMGVPAKQTSKARQVLERSAQIAGFFEFGKDKLVAPGVAQDTKADTTDTGKKKNGDGTGSGDGSGLAHLDPLLIALLKKIPPSGESWPGPQRARWFRTFAMNVSQIYDADDEQPVELKVELEPNPFA
jgi:hypothetical protein